MKINIDTYNNRNLVKNNLIKTAYRSNNFNEIPPIIGIIIADQYGNTISVIEYSNTESRYGPIKTYLSGNDKNLLELDLISMYFSSFKIFAGQTNIQNISHLEINGSNIKVQIYFLLEKFMIIVLLNSNTHLSSHEKAQIITYFKLILSTHDYEYTNFNETSSRTVIDILEHKSKIWLKKMNNKYLETFQCVYLKKHEINEQIVSLLEPIISNELKDYMENIPEELLVNLSKEIKNKIQDKLFELI